MAWACRSAKAILLVRSTATKQVLLAFFGLEFGKIDVQVADGVVFELLFAARRSVHHRRQTADAVALKAAVQRRAGKVWNRFLQGVEAVIER